VVLMTVVCVVGVWRLVSDMRERGKQRKKNTARNRVQIAKGQASSERREETEKQQF